MMSIKRPLPPAFLQKNWKKWSHKYAKDRAKNPSFSFQWVTHEKQKVDERLKPVLRDMQVAHCCYCDGFPVHDMSLEEVEHFRPKSLSPLLSYYWGNLLYCCTRCNRIKGNKFDKKLLKPDSPSYDFQYYFLFNYSNGQIEINPIATNEAQERAKFTLNLLDLNNENLCKARLRTLKNFTNDIKKEYKIEEYSYRFIFI